MRLVRASGLLLGGMLLVSLVTQPRPFFFDTLEVTESIQRFDRYRVLLLGGGMLRGLLVIPTILFGIALAEHLGHRSIWVSTGKAFMIAAGLLFTVSGFTAVVIGVPAEEYQLGAPEAKALEVLADSLFWIQDNLMTIAYITLALAVLGFSNALRGRTGNTSMGVHFGSRHDPAIGIGVVLVRHDQAPGIQLPVLLPGSSGLGCRLSHLACGNRPREIGQPERDSGRAFNLSHDRIGGFGLCPLCLRTRPHQEQAEPEPAGTREHDRTGPQLRWP